MDRLRTHLTPQMVDEASDWFVEFSEGTTEVAAREQFDAWLRRSPEHVQAYLRIAALWEESPALGKARVLPSDELVRRVLAEGNVVPLSAARTESANTREDQTSIDSTVLRSLPESGPLPARRQRTRRATWLAGAASFLITIAVTTWVYVQRDTYSTGTGEQRSVRLEDGSILDLNSQSKVRVRFAALQRNVELLEGQALFKVAKDPSRPFVVATVDTHVRAVGTEFDVYRKDGGTIVTVLEGRVAVTSTGAAAQSLSIEGDAPSVLGDRGTARATPRAHQQLASPAVSTVLETPQFLTAQSGEILVTAGEQVTVTPQAVPQPKPADLQEATAWTQRKIVFKGSPLGEVVDEFNRYNTRRLVIVDQALGATRISGVFSSTDPDSLLRFLRTLPNIVVEDNGSNYRISSR